MLDERHPAVPAVLVDGVGKVGERVPVEVFRRVSLEEKRVAVAGVPGDGCARAAGPAAAAAPFVVMVVFYVLQIHRAGRPRDALEKSASPWSLASSRRSLEVREGVAY